MADDVVDLSVDRIFDSYSLSYGQCISLSSTQAAFNGILSAFRNHDGNENTKFSTATMSYYPNGIIQYNGHAYTNAMLCSTQQIKDKLKSISSYFYSNNNDKIVDNDSALVTTKDYILSSMYVCNRIICFQYSFYPDLNPNSTATNITRLVWNKYPYTDLYENYETSISLSCPKYITPRDQLVVGNIIDDLYLRSAWNNIINYNLCSELLISYGMVNSRTTTAHRDYVYYYINIIYPIVPDLDIYKKYEELEKDAANTGITNVHADYEYGRVWVVDHTWYQEIFGYLCYNKTTVESFNTASPISIRPLHKGGIPVDPHFFSINCDINLSSLGRVDGNMNGIWPGSSTTLSAIDNYSIYTHELFPPIPEDFDARYGLFDKWKWKRKDSNISTTITSTLTIENITSDVNVSAYFIKNTAIDTVSNYLSDLMLPFYFNGSTMSDIVTLSCNALSVQSISQKYMLRGKLMNTTSSDSTLSIVVNDIENDNLISLLLSANYGDNGDWISTEIDLKNTDFTLSSTIFQISGNYDNIGQVWHIAVDTDLTYATYNDNTIKRIFLTEQITQAILTANIPKTMRNDNNITISVENIVFGDGVTGFSDGALSGYSTVKNVTIPNSVTSIGASVFNGCSSLTSITLPFVGSERGNSDVSSSVFGYIFGKNNYGGSTPVEQYYTRGSSITYYIPTSLRNVYITDETTLGYGAFNICSSLVSIMIPNSLSSIGMYAFNGCSSLISVTIPDSVTSIGDFAFNKCISLTGVTIPNSVTSIGGRAFSYCNNLSSLTISDGVLSIGNYAFEFCTSLISMTIGNSVTHINQFAFESCTSLTSMTIPNSVMSIGYGTFLSCSGLENVTIPDSVTSIESYAFSNCSNLTSVTIVANSGDAKFVKNKMMDAGVPSNINWNMPPS